jgi:hypothetical protein
MLSHKKNLHSNSTYYTLLHTSLKQHKMHFISGSSSKIMLTDLSTVHYLLLRIPKDTLISLEKLVYFLFTSVHVLCYQLSCHNSSASLSSLKTQLARICCSAKKKPIITIIHIHQHMHTTEFYVIHNLEPFRMFQ